MNHNTGESKSLYERALKVSPGGVHSPVRAFKKVGGPPRFIRSAQGAKLHDVDGNTYTDYCLSWGPLMFGHQDPEVRSAVDAALSRGWTYGAAEPYSLELAELLTSRLPWLQKLRFVSSGTEAVMSALRVARAASGRDQILKFDGCYHGHADSMLVRAGSGLAEMATPDSAGVPAACARDTIVVPLGDLAAVEEALSRHKVGAVILEPLPANNGLLIQTREWLLGVVEAAKRHGALVIFDEVISGFRVGLGGMAEWLGVRPDLVTYGKILGGGFPLGAYGGRSDLMDLVAPVGPVYQAGTLSANPVAVAAGLATVKKLIRENPYTALESETARLAQGLRGLGLDVRQQASLFWIVTDQYPELFHELLDRGVYLAPSAYEVGFLSTAHSKDDNDRFVAATREALGRIS